MNRKAARAVRHGFTLIELLVVIAIIFDYVGSANAYVCPSAWNPEPPEPGKIPRVGYATNGVLFNYVNAVDAEPTNEFGLTPDGNYSGWEGGFKAAF